MIKSKFERIDNARKILGLPKRATMEQIKRNYKELLLKWHPDKCKEKEDRCKKMTVKIIEAYRTIIEYCNNYEYSFAKEDVNKSLSPDDWWFERFGDDPLWGK